MKTLLIDTSTEMLVLILSDDKKLIDYHFELAIRDHSTRLMPCIDDLLTKNKLDITDINEIIVTEGPGSYTGLRIGVTVAKTLCYTLNIPLKTTSTLKLMGSSFVDKGKYILPVIDARRGNVFSALYKVCDSKLETVYGEQLYNYYELINQIKTEIADEVVIVGIKPESVAIYDKQFSFMLIPDNFNPEAVLKLEFEQVDNIHTFVPNYKRLPEAELNLK